MKTRHKNQDGLWGITTYFNPEKYNSKSINYRKFRESSKRQGLKLITIECSFGESPFELEKDDADILIQVRSNSVIWQKERLLNIGLENLPEECTKVAWLDADIIFLNNNWVSETNELLDNFKVVQLFEISVRLKKGQVFTDLSDFEYGPQNGEKRKSSVFIRNNKENVDYFPATGFGWAIRRDIIEEIGFYDKMILGGGDTVIVNSFYNKKEIYEYYNSSIEGLYQDILLWSNKMYDLVKDSVDNTNGTILHMYHGDMKNRLYEVRYKMIEKINFDIKKDIKINNYGCWEWNTENKKLSAIVKRYFSIRNEDKKNKMMKYTQ